MELNEQSSPKENLDIKSKATFRKPNNDAGSRKYRRHSPVNESSSSEGSPTREHNSSPIPSRRDPERGADYRRRKDDVRDLDRDSGRSRYGRSGESYRHSDRQSSRSSRGYHRHDDYHRRDKYADDDRDYFRSSRAGRDSRSDNYSDHSRRENEYRSRDYPRDVDKYSRDKSDGKYDKTRDKEYRSGWRDTSSADEDVKPAQEDGYEDKVGRDDKVGLRRYAEEQFEDKKGYSSRDQASSAKKTKLFYSDGSSNNGKDVTKAKGIVDEKKAPEPASKVVSEQGLTDSDIDAAKIAAIKAAEQVNKNLIGTGYMTADQKKKLLWGNKKTAAPEESGPHWDMAILGDRERQEKFNKLMSLRLHCLWRIVGCEGRRQSRPQTRRTEHREAEGAATAGSREAVHRWTSSKRWSHCWARSLITYWVHLCCVHATVFSNALFYYSAICFNDAH